MRTLIVRIAAFLLLCGRATGEDWPQFRGPHGDGRAEATNLPTTWGWLSHPPAWETSVPGTGWSSPIVTGDRIWLTSAEPTALNASAMEKKLAEHVYGSYDFQTDASVTLFAVELNASSGKILRRIDLLEEADPTPIHALNSYASPTLVTDGERVYCHFGSLGTVALAIDTGKIVWQRRLVVDDITGPACSPVLCDDRLILVRDGCDQQYVVALDKLTGETIWQQRRPPIDVADSEQRRGFSTPLIVQSGGRKQIIAPTAQWVVSYDPESGRELWKARLAAGYAVVPRAVFLDGLVYVCSGYRKAELAAVRVDGSGDVTGTHVEWTYDRQVPLIASPIAAGGEIYFASTTGVASCLDAKTGQCLWRHRLPGSYFASPLLADGKLYFTSKDGTTTVIRSGREFQRLAENEIFGQTLSSMAVCGESLLIRTASSLYCLRATPRDLPNGSAK
jgi:hypothetical protein